MIPGALPGAWIWLCLALWIGTWVAGVHREWIAAFWTSPGWSGAVLAGHLRAGAAAALVLFAGAGFSGPVIRWIGRKEWPPAGRIALGGAVLAPLVGLALGWPGLLRSDVVLPILMIGAVRGARAIRLTDVRSTSSPYRLCIFGLFLFLLLPSLILSLAPETHYDALQYHLALPDRFRLHGKVFDPAFPPFSRFHLGGEMLFALAGVAGGDAAIRLVTWALLPVTLALVLAGARQAGAGTSGTIAAGVALAASPLSALVAGHALTDLPALAAVAAAAGLRLGGRGPATGAAIGLLLGGAGAIKTTLVPLTAVALPFLARRGERRAMLAAWAIPIGPWIVRSWLESGSVTGGLFFPALLPAFDAETGIRPFLDHVEWAGAGWARWLALPGFVIGEGVRGGHELSPLLAAALPALLLPPGYLAPGTAPLARAALAMSAGWALAGGGQLRWLLPAFVLLLPAAAAVRVPRAPLIAATAVAGLLGWARICVFLFATTTPLPAALGGIPARAYLAARLTPPDLYLQVGDALRADRTLGRPYVIGDLKAYYWPREPVLDAQHVTPRLVRWANETGDVRRLHVRLRQQRIGCLVHRNEGSLTLQELAGGYRWTGKALNAVERLIAGSDRVLALERPESNAFYYVYALRPPARRTPIADLRWLALPGAEQLFVEGDAPLAAGNARGAEPVYRRLAERFPESALPWLRLAECARLRKDPDALRRCDREAGRRLD